MGKSSPSCLVAITLPFIVFRSCVACSDDFNDNLKGILGSNINLTCNTINTCDSIGWDRPENSDVGLLPGEPVKVGSSESYLPISGISIDDDGRYRCYCYASGAGIDICSVNLKTICQATVVLNGRMTVHNSTSRSHYVNVTVGTRVKIICPGGGWSASDCQSVERKDSGEFTYKFKVLSEHDSCHIVCQVERGRGDLCSVNLTLKVNIHQTSTPPLVIYTVASTVSSLASANEKSSRLTAVEAVSAQPSVKTRTFTTIPNDRSISATSHATVPIVQQEDKDNAVLNKSGRFPVMLLVGISIAVFVGILFIICFFIYSSRSKSTSRPQKIQIPVKVSSDTSIPIGPTYATVNKSSPECTKGDDDSERRIPCADDAYAEVDSSGKGESSTQQVNAVKAETSITKDYYSVVNTSSAKLEQMDSSNKSDSTLYTEVNKGDNQVGKKVGTSSPESSDCNPNVPDVQSYDVLEQPESSDYDDVGVGSSSPALYAVVEKERKKD